MGGVANTIVESVNNGKQAACYMHQYLQVYLFALATCVKHFGIVGDVLMYSTLF